MSGTQPYWMNSYYSVIQGSTGPTGPAGPVAPDFVNEGNGVVTDVSSVYIQAFYGQANTGNTFYITVNFNISSTVWTNGDSSLECIVFDTLSNTVLGKSTLDYRGVVATNSVVLTLPYQSLSAFYTVRIRGVSQSGGTKPTVAFTLSQFPNAV